MYNSSHRIALRVALIYVIIGSGWILFSDYWSLLLSENNIHEYMKFQRYKGWIFTIVTGILIYFLIYQHTKKLFQSTNALKETEEELQNSTLRYQSLYEHNPDAVVEFDLDGKIISINPVGKKMLNLKGEKGNETFYQLLDQKSKKHFLTSFQTVKNGQAVTFEADLENTHDQLKTLRCTLIPIIVNEMVTGVYGIAKDITHQKRNEELMLKSERMYIIGQLAAAVAHEIRNPLTSIKGFVQLMNETKSLNQVYLDVMMEEIDRMNTITSEMLLLGKDQNLHYEDIDIQELLHTIKVLMEAQAHYINATLKLNRHQQPIYILGDPNQLKQLFINIIQNSIEAIHGHLDKKSGEINIFIQEKSDSVTISISDNGTGIEMDRMKRLGEPFYSTKEKGTGLGLAICMKIVKQHKGTLHFDSEIGKGTTVTVSLPKKPIL